MDGSHIVRVPPSHTIHYDFLLSTGLLMPPCSIQSVTAFLLYLVGYVNTGLGKLWSFRKRHTAVFFFPSNSNTSFSSIKSVEVISTSFKNTVKNTCPTSATSSFGTDSAAIYFFTFVLASRSTIC